METAEYVTHLECALTNMRAKYEQTIDENAALRAEVERLREACHSIIREADTLLTHVDIDVDFRYYQGQAAAAKRLLALQPLPAPPVEEE